jgi:hypothetical protein
MRRLLIPLLAACLAVVPAGCGGGSKPPLDEGLGYVPKGSPFVVAIDTDVGGGQYQAVGRLAKRFPFGPQAGDQLKRLFERGGDVDFDRDIRPLLGNPFVVGSASPRSFIGGSPGEHFIGAIKSKDGGKLKDLAERTHATKEGDKDGGTIYRDNQGGEFAIKGDTLVVAGSRAQLEEALARRADGKGLSRESFDDSVQDLPSTALVRGFFDIGGLVRTSPRAAQARRIPWVAALGSLGFSVRAEDRDVAVDFKLKSDRAKLSPGQLPLAAGGGAPSILRTPGEISIGVRDPGQVADFVLGATKAASPQFEAGRRQLEQAVGIDLKRDLSDQLSGGATLNVSVGGSVGARADVRDPAAFKRTLRKLAGALPRFARSSGAGSAGLTRVGGGLYSLARPGRKPLVFGVVGRTLVAADTAARARRLAAARPQAVPGLDGSLVLEADAERLAQELVHRLTPGSGGLPVAVFTTPLGELTGSVRSSAGDMRGRLRLGID